MKNNARRTHKYWHYGFTISILVALLALAALLNGFYHFYSVQSYKLTDISIPFADFLAGYIGIFVSILLLPIPDYVLIPFYGYLCSIGIFNPYLTLLASVGGAVVPIEFLLGIYAGSKVLKKILSHMEISEVKLSVATNWVKQHGNFSIFLATFVPFFYSAASFSAGTLKMRFPSFMTVSTLGFLLRYVGLELIGYYGLYLFTSQYDYKYRYVFTSFLFISLIYIVVYSFRDSVASRTPAPY
ncbi:MAG: DedA family protein [Thermoplasmatales archaeon]